MGDFPNDYLDAWARSRGIDAASLPAALAALGVESSAGVLRSKEFLFTETDGAGTYTATMSVAAGTTIFDVLLMNRSDAEHGVWASDTAIFTMGDVITGPTAYYDAITLAPIDPAPVLSIQYGTTGGTSGFGATIGFSCLSLIDSYTFGSAAYFFAGVYGRATSPNGDPYSYNAGIGVCYFSSDTITMKIVTTQAAPVTPKGVLLVKVLYWEPITASNAVKS